VEDTFLQHILDDPLDLVVRRVYADWLMEQPDAARRERGEFITLQFNLADGVRPEQLRQECLRRQAELLARHGEEWAGPGRHWVAKYTFRHGFLEAVTLDWNTLVQLGADLFRLAPIHEVRPTGLSADNIAEIADSPNLGRITTLNLARAGLGPFELELLLASPHLGKLRRLVLDRNPIGDHGLRALVGSPYLGQLTHLSLVGTDVSPDGVRALLLPGREPLRLEHLNLRANRRFGYVEAQALLAVVFDPELRDQLRRLLAPLERRVSARQYLQVIGRPGSDSVELLRQGLPHSSAEVRAAAASALANCQLPAALPTVPALLRRAFERGSVRAREAAKETLRNFQDRLPPLLGAWLAGLRRTVDRESALFDPESGRPVATVTFVNVQADAESSLLRVLDDATLPLPPAVQAAFAAVCERRLRWREAHRRETVALALPAAAATDRAALGHLVRQVAALAEQAALRHARPSQAESPSARRDMRARECAWLCDWLVEFLRRHEAGEPIPDGARGQGSADAP
jgi:uncharacterized protein (TIGR02996 family)